MNTLEQTMKQAVENKTAKILTLDLAKELKGKRIATIYFGYRGQNGVNDFIVGEIKSRYDLAKEELNCGKYSNRAEYWESYMTENQLEETKTNLMLMKEDETNTHIGAHSFNDGAFTCSDSDRFVYFIEVPQLKKAYLDGRDEFYFIAVKGTEVITVNKDEEKNLDKLINFGYQVYRYNYWHVDAQLLDGNWIEGNYYEIEKVHLYSISNVERVVLTDAGVNNDQAFVVTEIEFVNKFQLNPGVKVLFRGTKDEADNFMISLSNEN